MNLSDHCSSGLLLISCRSNSASNSAINMLKWMGVIIISNMTHIRKLLLTCMYLKTKFHFPNFDRSTQFWAKADDSWYSSWKNWFRETLSRENLRLIHWFLHTYDYHMYNLHTALLSRHTNKLENSNCQVFVYLFATNLKKVKKLISLLRQL